LHGRKKHTCGDQNCKLKLREETNIEKFGVPYASQNRECQIKAAKVKFMNQSAFVSPQQRYIANALNGVTNFNIDKYLIDVALLEKKIAIEFDGIGHDMGVSLGRLTQEQFEQQELERESYIFKDGFSLIRVVSANDYLFDKTELKKLLKICESKFLDKAENKIVIDIDTCHKSCFSIFFIVVFSQEIISIFSCISIKIFKYTYWLMVYCVAKSSKYCY
jgi:very-short-patch-repair endonuclease